MINYIILLFKYIVDVFLSFLLDPLFFLFKFLPLSNGLQAAKTTRWSTDNAKLNASHFLIRPGNRFFKRSVLNAEPRNKRLEVLQHIDVAAKSRLACPRGKGWHLCNHLANQAPRARYLLRFP